MVETIVERPAALDVHKAQMTACVRPPDDRGRREERVAEFATTVRGLLALRDWLAAHRVGQVVMEATGVYWKAPWAILEDEFECLLVNAPRQAGPRSQDRRLGCRVAVPARRGRAAQGELRAVCRRPGSSARPPTLAAILDSDNGRDGPRAAPPHAVYGWLARIACTSAPSLMVDEKKLITSLP